jgi:hypothetical protein
MNEEEEEAPWRTRVSTESVLPRRGMLLDPKTSVRQMPADGQLKKMHATMCRLRRMPAGR